MDNCPHCGKLIDQETKAIYHSICKSWLHKICSNVTDEQYAKVTSSPKPFYCHIYICESRGGAMGCQMGPLPPPNFAWPPQWPPKNFPRDVMPLH